MHVTMRRRETAANCCRRSSIQRASHYLRIHVCVLVAAEEHTIYRIICVCSHYTVLSTRRHPAHPVSVRADSSTQRDKRSVVKNLRHRQAATLYQVDSSTTAVVQCHAIVLGYDRHRIHNIMYIRQLPQYTERQKCNKQRTHKNKIQ